MIPVTDIVQIVGFTSILFMWPMPFPLLPVVAALCFPGLAAEAAWVGFIASLYLGTPYMLIRAVLPER